MYKIFGRNENQITNSLCRNLGVRIYEHILEHFCKYPMSIKLILSVCQISIISLNYKNKKLVSIIKNDCVWINDCLKIVIHIGR